MPLDMCLSLRKNYLHFGWQISRWKINNIFCRVENCLEALIFHNANLKIVLVVILKVELDHERQLYQYYRHTPDVMHLIKNPFFTIQLGQLFYFLHERACCMRPNSSDGKISAFVA